MTKCRTRYGIKNSYCEKKGEDNNEYSSCLLGNYLYTKNGLGFPLLSIHTGEPCHLTVFTYAATEDTERKLLQEGKGQLRVIVIGFLYIVRM